MPGIPAPTVWTEGYKVPSLLSRLRWTGLASLIKHPIMIPAIAGTLAGGLGGAIRDYIENKRLSERTLLGAGLGGLTGGLSGLLLRKAIAKTPVPEKTQRILPFLEGGAYNPEATTALTQDVLTAMSDAQPAHYFNWLYQLTKENPRTLQAAALLPTIGQAATQLIPSSAISELPEGIRRHP